MPNKNLAELRKQCEKGYDKILIFPHCVDRSYMVYVLLEKDETCYINRYFKIGETWQVSVDIKDISTYMALTFLDNEFKDVYELVCGKSAKKGKE